MSMKFMTLGLGLLALAGCSITPYDGGADTVIATGIDGGSIDRGQLVNGRAAIAYDPDGCQNWIIDDGIEGYSSPRYDPATGLPVCNNHYPPGTVLGDRQQSAGRRDWVPARSFSKTKVQ